jgi:serine/threonine protein kinase
MHDRGVIHADIKLENVYLPDVNSAGGTDSQFEGAVIGDFGLAGVMRTETAIPARPSHHQKYFRGTTEYLAPEVAARLSPPHPPSDVWSAALTCFVALTGTHPFQQIRDDTVGRQLRTSFRGRELEKLIALHERSKDTIKSILCVLPDVSGKALSFFLKVMRLSPWDRPTADECLRNPWLALS